MCHEHQSGCRTWPKSRVRKRERVSGILLDQTARRVEEDIVGHGPRFVRVLNQVDIIAKGDSVTLIQGETARARKSSPEPFTIRVCGTADHL